MTGIKLSDAVQRTLAASADKDIEAVVNAIEAMIGAAIDDPCGSTSDGRLAREALALCLKELLTREKTP
jgi:hypothetical protein